MAVAPNLLLEMLADKRLTEDAVARRLQVGTRVAAGGFSHIYLGKLRLADADDDAERPQVAVKQYIQRKPIFFSFDTPEERAAKNMEMEQGAVVVFRRLQQEVRMLAAKDSGAQAPETQGGGVCVCVCVRSADTAQIRPMRRVCCR